MPIEMVSVQNLAGWRMLTIWSVETLDHYEVPFFGRLANSFVDDE